MTQKIKSFLHTLFFKRSTAKELIEADVKRWVQIHKPERSKRTIIENFVWLLETHPEYRNLFYFRLGRFTNFSSRVMLTLAKIIYKPVESFIFSEIAQIGPALFAENGNVILVGAEKIGKNCWLNPGVTIGYKTGREKTLPIIGDNVYIGSGARILGSITIGDNVMVGANAVVTRDVPSNCTVAGVPGRIVKRDGIRVNEPLPR
jgi:serine O-acetyltransferase